MENEDIMLATMGSQKKVVLPDPELLGPGKIERKCFHCGWIGLGKMSQIGEYETWLCPNNHILSFKKTKIINKVTKKQTAKKNEIIAKMPGFKIGRNNNLSIETNKVYCENNLVTFSRMNDNYLDLIVTSPPYDDLRKYEKVEWDYKKVFLEAYRTLKPGGVIVWVVGDETNEGESCSSFEQIIFATKTAGFRLHDTMIYKKHASPYPAGTTSMRYTQIFEFMFVLSKDKPKTVNLIEDKINTCKGQFNSKIKKTIKEYGPRDNIWEYKTGGVDTHKDPIASLHPAVFPELLAADHIKSWSNEGDIVYDCFAGSGTTLKIAHDLKRLYIGSEISDKYCKIIDERLRTLFTKTK